MKKKLLMASMLGCISLLGASASSSLPTGLAVNSVKAISFSDSMVQITIALTEKAQAQIEYGTTDSYGLLSIKEKSFRYDKHVQSLTGLRPTTTYHYRVHAWDAQGREILSKEKITGRFTKA